MPTVFLSIWHQYNLSTAPQLQQDLFRHWKFVCNCEIALKLSVVGMTLADIALLPVCTPVCLPKIVDDQLRSTVCDTLTIDKYLTQPHFKLSL